MNVISNREKIECDVVVLGAGGAGLAAAVMAADQGAKVVVLEKRGRAGGSTMFAEGIAAAESPLQKRLNVECSNDDLFKIHMYYSHWTLNARLVRAIINISGDTVQWLEDKGVKFGLHPLYPDQQPLVQHIPENNGSDIIKVLLKDCQDKGVSVLYNTRAIKLITDQSGTMTGVMAESDEQEIELKAKSVIVSTGGYGANMDLLKKYCSYLENPKVHRFVPKEITGDGIQMAFDIGAADEGLGNLLLHGPIFIGYLRNLFGLIIEPDTIWLNRDGERYMEESASFNPFVSANGVIRQPGQVSFTIFDEAIKNDKIKNGFKRPFTPGGMYAPDHTKLDSDLQNGGNKEGLMISDSWDEIAQWMGVEPEVLKRNIDEYNACCDKGHDDLFAKDAEHLKPLRIPPFYAAKCYPGFIVTIGGIKINHLTEVLNKQNQPIQGLYAAGIDTGGWSASTYNARLAGTGQGFSVYTGRIAGKNAAQYAAAQISD